MEEWKYGTIWEESKKRWEMPKEMESERMREVEGERKERKRARERDCTEDTFKVRKIEFLQN